MNTIKTFENELIEILDIIKQFILLISEFGIETSENIEKVINEINLIPNTDSWNNWSACFDLYDYDLMILKKEKDEGIYWKSWSVYCESDKIEIEAFTKHTEKIFYDEDYFHFYTIIDLKKKIIYQEARIQNFLDDARKIKTYMINKPNEIECEVTTYSKNLA